MTSRSKKGSTTTTRTNDPTWEHCSRVNDSRMHVKYNYCGLERWGGINRIKHHLAGDHDNVAPCTKCPENVRELFIKILRETETQKTNANECFEVGEGEQGNQNLVEGRKTSIDSFVNKGKGLKQYTLNAMVKIENP